MITIATLYGFDALCTQIGAKTPAPVVRGLQLHTEAHARTTPRTRSLLELTDEQIDDVIFDFAVRAHKGDPDQIGLAAGMPAFDMQLLEEIGTATLPLLDDLVTSMQPVFDQVVEPIVTAVRQYGFTGTTTAEEVLLRRRSEDAEAFMAAKDAMTGLQPLVAFRQAVSSTFEVEPWGRRGAPVDYSVAFAAGDNWSLNGEFNRALKHPGLVNFIALASGGLRLNTPSEVRRKLQQRRWDESRVSGDTATADTVEDLDITPGARYPVSSAKGA
jgi:hypothetical protein